MPRNVQGLYTLPAGNPVSPGTVIESVWANTTMDDLAQAMTDSLPRNGSAPMTGPLTLTNSSPSDPRHATSKAYVDQFMAYSSGMPIGAVAPFAGATGPAGWLKCDGAAVSRTTYANLFTVIGTTFGSGDNSTTFNLPDLRSEFIRGRSDSRALGSKQAASFASHTHPTSDPGHAHAVSDPGHAHGISIQSGDANSDHTHAWGAQTGDESAAHTHGVSDPGHSHVYTDPNLPSGGSNSYQNGPQGYAWRAENIAANSTSHVGTGISLGTESAAHSHYVSGQTGGMNANHSHAVNGTSVGAATGLGVAGAYSGLSIGVNGGIETVPQNMALDYYIKAVADGTGSANLLTGVETSDANMISVDNTNPVVPLLVIHPNVAFGIPKLDAAGKIPLALMPNSGSEFMGYFDASSGNLPSGAFVGGNYYAISVGGTLNVFDPVTLVQSLTVVAVGGQIHYVANSVTNPTGWYYVTVAGATLASDVQFIPGGGITSTNVQTAIAELDTDTTAGLALKLNLTGGTVSGQVKGIMPVAGEDLARKDYVDTKLPLTGGTLSGQLTATKLQTGVSVTAANNFTLDASADNGTMKLTRNSGQDIMTVDAAGKVSFPQTGGLIPTGAMQMFFMNTAPAGWLEANGALVSRTTYAALFNAIGTVYGVGDGSTTFQLPDMRGYFPRANGTNANGVTSGAFGAKQGQATIDHTHYALASGNAFFAWLTAGGAYNAPAGGSLNLEFNQLTGSSNTAGVSGQSETRPVNMALLCCVKA